MNQKNWIKILLAFSLIIMPLSVEAGELLVYQVKAGDSLWKIAQQYGVSVQNLQRANGINTHIIHPGQVLTIPNRNKVLAGKDTNKDKNNADSAVYVIKTGDSLWSIAQRYRTDVSTIKTLNGLTSSLIYSGQTLKVPGVAKVKDSAIASVVSYTNDDFYWLARIIQAEAGGEPYKGKVAVGSVIINRVQSNSFPNSIKKVIFQNTNGVYQFSPVGNGKIYQVKPSADAIKAARAALEGTDPTEGSIYFYNPATAKSKWIRTRKVVAVIGNHNFAV